MIATNNNSGPARTINESGWKIVEVAGDPELHMKNISKPGAHVACCGKQISNVTGIPAEYWAHSTEEYQWCQQCERRILAVSRSQSVPPPIPWLGKC